MVVFTMPRSLYQATTRWIVLPVRIVSYAMVREMLSHGASAVSREGRKASVYLLHQWGSPMTPKEKRNARLAKMTIREAIMYNTINPPTPEECDHSYCYTGKIPCTGEYKCRMCGHVKPGGHW